MAASGRTEEASDFKVGVGAPFIEFYLWSKLGDPSPNAHIVATATTEYAPYAINAFANSTDLNWNGMDMEYWITDITYCTTLNYH